MLHQRNMERQGTWDSWMWDDQLCGQRRWFTLRSCRRASSVMDIIKVQSYELLGMEYICHTKHWISFVWTIHPINVDRWKLIRHPKPDWWSLLAVGSHWLAAEKHFWLLAQLLIGPQMKDLTMTWTEKSLMGAKCGAQELEMWRTGFLHWDNNWKLESAAQASMPNITVILQCLNLTLSNTGLAVHWSYYIE